MSFLVEDDTLEAALAFLDGYDDVDVDDELGADLDLTSASSCGSPSRAPASGSPCSSSNGSTSQSSRSPERAGRHSGAVATTRAKPKRSNAPAAMRLRRKRKAERLHLRDQVAELEALLRRLRQERGSSRTEPALAVSRPREASLAGPIEESEFVRWADVATQIQREREQAEMENIQLRDILAKQVKLARNLEGLLQKRGVFQGIDLVFQPPRPTRTLSPFVDFNAESMLGDMEKRIQKLYSGIDSVFSSTVEDAVTSHFTMKQRPESGDPFMEVTTTTPLACSYEEALGIMLSGVKLKETLSNKQPIHRRDDDDKFSEKTFMVLLRDQHHDVSLRGVYLMRKFASDDHVAYICTSVVRPALEGDLQFRECGWITLTHSQTDPLRASTFRTCYHVYPERRGPPREKTSAFQRLGHLERFVLNSYARNTRTLLQRVQDALLDELERQTFARKTINRV